MEDYSKQKLFENSNMTVKENIEEFALKDNNLQMVKPCVEERSSLEAFNKSKKAINDIYCQIEDYILEIANLIDNIPKRIQIVNDTERELLQNYIQKISAIREVLNRNQMKVAFFGRTSNGKSSVINAMLGERILPSGIGHVTNCFCQVEGIHDTEGYIIKEGTDEKLNISNIPHLVNALCQEKSNENSLIKIYLPKDRCNLLRDDIIFLDTPGVDVSQNVDDWIDKYCLNSDVFVLLLNSESTISVAEKSFFHTVSQRLSKPNIFILNNRWDASTNNLELDDAYYEKVRLQHYEKCIDFLVNELKVCTEKEASERVYFVSAREMLSRRLEKAKGNLVNVSALNAGFHNRYLEFQDFERKFKECILGSAIRTKFQHHCNQGKIISKEIQTVINDISNSANILGTEKSTQKCLLINKLEKIKNKLNEMTKIKNLQIQKIIEDVQQNVAKVLKEEISSLDVLIKEFNKPFDINPVMLRIYKRELNAYVGSKLDLNLQTKLSRAQAININKIELEMVAIIDNLISLEKFNFQNNEFFIRGQPSGMLHAINCKNLFSDFQEDLEFKFSLGIKSMIHRFTGKKKEENKRQPELKPCNNQNVVFPIPNDQEIPLQNNNIVKDRVQAINCFIFESRDTMSSLLFAGVLVKIIGWRSLIGFSVLCGCVYTFKRFSWTVLAKEKSFREQYIRHVTKKLELIVNFVSGNCSNQVKQEISRTFYSLCQNIDLATTEINEEIIELENDISVLESIENNIELLKSKINHIENELIIFENTYFNGDQ